MFIFDHVTGAKPILKNTTTIDKPLTVIGMMSGTSVDAIDACCVTLAYENDKLVWDIKGTASLNYPSHIRNRLLTSMAGEPVSLQELASLNLVVARLYVDVVWKLLQQIGTEAVGIDAIGSHGQTVFHSPPKSEGLMGLTYQIGDGSVIAQQTGITTVCDFRQADMAVAGQGAPLVCFADKLLFQSTSKTRCIQNIGGIANVTVLPKDTDDDIMAFDTGPGNMLMDLAAMHFYQQPYDKDGELAASGTCNDEVLSALLNNTYLHDPLPKTTGRDEFGDAFFQSLLTQYPEVLPEDWMATLTTFTARSIAEAYSRFIQPTHQPDEMIVGGGGVKNNTLMSALRNVFVETLPSMEIKTHQDVGINDQYKEALAFAVLAWSNLHGVAGNIPSCTGARHGVILGKVCLAQEAIQL